MRNAVLPAIDRVTNRLASAVRLRNGSAFALRSGPEPPKPILELYEYEASPFCRRVRETLCVLELPALIKPCPRETLRREGAFSPAARYKPEIVPRGGRLLFPFLVDHTSSVQLNESGAICDYLWKTYGGDVIQRPASDGWLNSMANTDGARASSKDSSSSSSSSRGDASSSTSASSSDLAPASMLLAASWTLPAGAASLPRMTWSDGSMLPSRRRRKRGRGRPRQSGRCAKPRTRPGARRTKQSCAEKPKKRLDARRWSVRNVRTKRKRSRWRHVFGVRWIPQDIALLIHDRLPL